MRLIGNSDNRRSTVVSIFNGPHGQINVNLMLYGNCSVVRRATIDTHTEQCNSFIHSFVHSFIHSPMALQPFVGP
jgi:hypothetical protein